MSNRFLDLYSGYSNIELLKVIKQADDYQPEAVDAASSILQGRIVTQEEYDEVEHYYETIAAQKSQQVHELEAVKTQLQDALEPVWRPGTEVTPEKWFTLFMLALVLQYLWQIYKTFTDTLKWKNCEYCTIDSNFILDYVGLAYGAILIYLLFKRHRTGWMLIFGTEFFLLVSGISQAYIFFRYQEQHGGHTLSFIWAYVIHAIFVAFLWRQTIASLFDITPEKKKKFASVILWISLTITACALGYALWIEFSN